MARILIVDDTDDIREMLANLLTLNGHLVDTAKNGVEAVERFRENPADLLICDMMMPLKGGLETIGELRAENPDLKILAISGAFDVTSHSKAGEARMWASKMGADASISKPFDTEYVEKVVRTLLSSV